MADTNTSERAQQPSLDDVMIAMDVVDTLRHDARIAERELNDDKRRADLIKRLREIYAGQGLTVPDHILEQGVQALEEDRFVYRPPLPGISRGLAEWYVTRNNWGRYAVGAIVAICTLWLAHYALVQRPQTLLAEQARVELADTLPAEITSLSKSISMEARDGAAGKQADALATDGRDAIAAKDVQKARAVRDDLRALLAKIRADYEIRIVNRPGTLTGLWRVPRANPDTYNYYLVVEAIGRSGKPAPQPIENEETGKTERVATWAIRVPRDVLVRVREDKSDDGIIENRVVGRKVRGRLEPTYDIERTGGAITQW